MKRRTKPYSLRPTAGAVFLFGITLYLLLALPKLIA